SNYRLKMRIMDVVLQVNQAYWDLVFARRDLEVKKESLANAQDLFNNNKKQVEVGTMAPLEVVVAQAEVAAREEDIIAADAVIRNTEDRLKTLLLGIQTTSLWSQTLIPADEPKVDTTEIDEMSTIQQGLNNSPDLQALQSDLNAQNFNVKAASSALKPQLDLVGSFGWTGIGGNTFLFLDNDPITNPVPIGVVNGGYGNAVSNMFKNPTVNLGLNVGVPFGNKSAEADYIRATVTQKQSTVALDNAKKQLALNIRTT